MPRIPKGSCIIDLPLHLAGGDPGERLDTLIRALVRLYEKGCDIYMSREPFTSNIRATGSVYRLGFAPSTILIYCRETRDLETIPVECYTSTEDLWLRTRHMYLCIRPESPCVREVLGERDTGGGCGEYSLLEVSERPEDVVRTYTGRPIVVFRPPRGYVEEVVMRRNRLSTHLLSYIVDGLRSLCVYTGSIEKTDSIKTIDVIAYDSLYKRPLIYLLEDDVIVSLCTPTDCRDPLYKATALYIMFRDHVTRGSPE